MDPEYRELYKKMSADNKEKLFDLHLAATAICAYIDYMVENKASREALNMAMRYLEKLEFEMQDCWGFERDNKKHTWWLKPESCLCPKLDNVDPCFFGSGKIIRGDCPLHGCCAVAEKKD